MPIQLQPSAAARDIFRAAVKGSNIMTPDTVVIGFAGHRQRYAVEITTGTGFKREPIWGFTVVDAYAGESVHELSSCCWSEDEVNDKLAQL